MNDNVEYTISRARTRLQAGELMVNAPVQSLCLDNALALDEMADAEELVAFTEGYHEYADNMVLNFENTDQDLAFIKALRAVAKFRYEPFCQLESELGYNEQLRGVAAKKFSPFIKNFYTGDRPLDEIMDSNNPATLIEALNEIYLKGSYKVKVEMMKTELSLEW